MVTTRIRNVQRDPSHLFSHLYQRDTKNRETKAAAFEEPQFFSSKGELISK